MTINVMSPGTYTLWVSSIAHPSSLWPTVPLVGPQWARSSKSEPTIGTGSAGPTVSLTSPPGAQVP